MAGERNKNGIETGTAHHICAEVVMQPALRIMYVRK